MGVAISESLYELADETSWKSETSVDRNFRPGYVFDWASGILSHGDGTVIGFSTADPESVRFSRQSLDGWVEGFESNGPESQIGAPFARRSPRQARPSTVL